MNATLLLSWSANQKSPKVTKKKGARRIRRVTVRKDILPLRKHTFSGLIRNASSDSHMTIATSLAGMSGEKGVENRRTMRKTLKRNVNSIATLVTNLGVGIPFGK